ncbi:MAG: hypothetical protein P8076_11285 [Gammaproteobacteria bacterium]
MEEFGAFCFGAVLGWYVYFVNRYRTDAVKLSDLTTVLGVIGGAGVLRLFGAGEGAEAASSLFGAYGIGLAVGFFGYFALLVYFVLRSDQFTLEWFLDGRRKKLPARFEIPGGTAVTTHPMADRQGKGNAGEGDPDA